MSVAAAIRITSPDEERVIRHAAEFAQQQRKHFFVISIVRELPYGQVSEVNREIVMRNLELIAESNASPVMQEGSDIARTLVAAAKSFGIGTLFLQGGSSHLLGRSIAEQLLYLDPPFDVVVVGSE
jgi:K+-sensing histidine kinase KdpD